MESAVGGMALFHMRRRLLLLLPLRLPRRPLPLRKLHLPRKGSQLTIDRQAETGDCISAALFTRSSLVCFCLLLSLPQEIFRLLDFDPLAKEEKGPRPPTFVSLAVRNSLFLFPLLLPFHSSFCFLGSLHFGSCFYFPSRCILGQFPLSAFA